MDHTQFAALILLVAFMQWLCSLWIESRLKESIKHEYDKKLEDYKIELSEKQKAEAAANLFSKWIKYRGQESKFLSSIEQTTYFEDLNRMTMQLVFWIKDVELLNTIMVRLQNEDKAKDTREIICDIRKLIIKDPDDKFKPDSITIWPTGNDYSELFMNTRKIIEK